MPDNFWKTIKSPFRKARKTIGEWFKGKPKKKAMVFEVGEGLTPEQLERAREKIREITKGREFEAVGLPFTKKEWLIPREGIEKRIKEFVFPTLLRTPAERIEQRKEVLMEEGIEPEKAEKIAIRRELKVPVEEELTPEQLGRLQRHEMWQRVMGGIEAIPPVIPVGQIKKVKPLKVAKVAEKVMPEEKVKPIVEDIKKITPEPPKEIKEVIPAEKRVEIPPKIIPKELEPLAREARKYKSAEEFVNAIKHLTDDILKRENNLTRDINIIGSVARGKKTPHDVDVVVSVTEYIRYPKDRERLRKQLKNKLQPFFAKKLHLEISDLIPGEPKISLTDFYNQAVKGVKEVKPAVAVKKAPKVVPAVKPPDPLAVKLEPPIRTPLPGEKPRGFVETIKKADKTTQELKIATKDIYPYYEPLTNKEALRKADDLILKNPDEARLRVLSVEEPISAEKSALAIRLIKKYEAEKNYDAAIDLLESYDVQLRDAGRFVQAASLWNKLSPEGTVRIAERTAKKLGRELPKEVKKQILKRMKEISKMPEGAERDKATLDVLNYIAEKLPPRWGEILDAYRYQNMLSSPRSHERNILGNLWQVYITRPLDLVAEATYDLLRHPFNPLAREINFADIPRYYKHIFLSFGNAVEAFKEGFRSGYISEKILEVGKTGDIIETIRRTKLPPIVTAVPRFMEAQDRFFSVLIASGEKARLLKKGLSETEADSLAKKLGEKYLFRERLGITTKDKALIVRALDNLGHLALRIRDYPIIGKPWAWFVPFVRTPINIAKFAVERSPFGFIGGKYTKEQISRAFLGTIITGIGAMLALQDRTTWMPPHDPKAKKLFYDAGRKPMSILIGDKWVPMWYFGPFSVALGLPAAIKHYYTETKTAPTESEINKIVRIILGLSRLITQQTPMAGMSAFMQALQGDVDYSLPGEIARTLKQAVPFMGLVSYINSWLDPIYRKSPEFVQALKRDLPFISKDLPVRETSLGTPAQRERWMLFFPYDIGIRKEEFERLYRERIKHLQELERERLMKKEEEGLMGLIKTQEGLEALIRTKEKRGLEELIRK